MATLANPSPATLSDAEWRTRVDLAACFRLIALHGWDDALATHVSARIPGEEGCFLLNPFGLLFEEVTASSLMKVAMDGTLLAPSPYPMNPAAFTIHSAIMGGRPDAGCAIHLHTLDGVAVSCMEEGLLPLNQTALYPWGDLAYHDYEGVATDLDEREGLQRDLGSKSLMILRNHGTLAVGDNVPHAWANIYMLERACTTQVRALSMGRPINAIAPEAIAKVTGGNAAPSLRQVGELGWPAMLRKIDRHLPGYAQ